MTICPGPPRLNRSRASSSWATSPSAPTPLASSKASSSSTVTTSPSKPTQSSAAIPPALPSQTEGPSHEETSQLYRRRSCLRPCCPMQLGRGPDHPLIRPTLSRPPRSVWRRHQQWHLLPGPCANPCWASSASRLGLWHCHQRWH